MLALLIIACRRDARRGVSNGCVATMWLSGCSIAQDAPDHTSIAGSAPGIRTLPACSPRFLQLCSMAGMVKVGVVAIDGSRSRGNASRTAERSPESVAREVERISAPIARTS